MLARAMLGGSGTVVAETIPSTVLKKFDEALPGSEADWAFTSTKPTA
jgi:hypothetical protein